MLGSIGSRGTNDQQTLLQETVSRVFHDRHYNVTRPTLHLRRSKSGSEVTQRLMASLRENDVNRPALAQKRQRLEYMKDMCYWKKDVVDLKVLQLKMKLEVGDKKSKSRKRKPKIPLYKKESKSPSGFLKDDHNIIDSRYGKGNKVSSNRIELSNPPKTTRSPEIKESIPKKSTAILLTMRSSSPSKAFLKDSFFSRSVKGSPRLFSKAKVNMKLDESPNIKIRRAADGYNIYRRTTLQILKNG